MESPKIIGAGAPKPDGKNCRVVYPDGHTTTRLTPEQARKRIQRFRKQYLQQCVTHAIYWGSMPMPQTMRLPTDE
ncbi:hypothetical protein [Alteromonas phage JH01]|mgnify:CR=1 FL=1|nr:hypothetical protein [Alteromonas phage JH01]